MRVLRNVTLCWWRYYNITEYDALLKVSQYRGLWRSVDWVMTLFRNVIVCYLRCHVIEKCDAQLMKILQYYGIWRSVVESITILKNGRSVDEDITLLRNMTLCWWTDHTLAEYNALLMKASQDWGMWRSFDEDITEYDALFKVSQYWGMWRSVDGDITVLCNMTLFLRFHNIEECDAHLVKLSQYWGMWRTVV